MTEVIIRSLTMADVAAAGAVLAASHAEYPAFRVDFPNPNVRRRVLLTFQTAAVRDVIRYGKAIGAYLDDRLAGVALRQPPGQFPSALRQARMAPALLRVAAVAPRAFPGLPRPARH